MPLLSYLLYTQKINQIAVLYSYIGYTCSNYFPTEPQGI